ncbi:MAG: hypothetical protein JRN42_05860 [Nitrososphaerota archaeon]|nr:hypothetical protein [Nitrososphaerota archaeon]
MICVGMGVLRDSATEAMSYATNCDVVLEELGTFARIARDEGLPSGLCDTIDGQVSEILAASKGVQENLEQLIYTLEEASR